MEGKTVHRLTEAQMAFFDTEGYLMVNDVFVPTDLEPVRNELSGLIDGKVKELINDGDLDPRDSFPQADFNTRLARINELNPQAAEKIMQYLEGFWGGGYRGKALFETIVHTKLLAVIEDLIGPEIVGSSVYRLRPKLPKIDRGVIPWHQDSGFWMPHCDQELIITCWLPLVEATFENGCLTILPRAHKGEIAKHNTDGAAGSLEIRVEDLPEGGEPTVVPVPLGGALFFTNRTPHCSTPNSTDFVRWSLDIRYQSVETPSNYGETPEEFTMDRPDYEIACNPPEADFLIKSRQYPDKIIRTYEQFHDLRESYEKRLDRSKIDFRRRWPSLKSKG